MNITIDRFEENFAIVETENRIIFSMPKSLFTDTAKEGDVFNISLIFDKLETENRRKKITNLASDIWID